MRRTCDFHGFGPWLRCLWRPKFQWFLHVFRRYFLSFAEQFLGFLSGIFPAISQWRSRRASAPRRSRRCPASAPRRSGAPRWSAAPRAADETRPTRCSWPRRVVPPGYAGDTPVKHGGHGMEVESSQKQGKSGTVGDIWSRIYMSICNVGFGVWFVWDIIMVWTCRSL